MSTTPNTTYNPEAHPSASSTSPTDTYTLSELPLPIPESHIIPHPICIGMQELPGTSLLRARVSRMMYLRDMERLKRQSQRQDDIDNGVDHMHVLPSTATSSGPGPEPEPGGVATGTEGEDIDAPAPPHHVSTDHPNFNPNDEDDGEDDGGSPPPDQLAQIAYDTPLYTHLAHGLAYTTGSALALPVPFPVPSSALHSTTSLNLNTNTNANALLTPPSYETCLAAYLLPNKVGLTAGARAWCKHAHRSIPLPLPSPLQSESTPSSNLPSTPSTPPPLDPPSPPSSTPTPVGYWSQYGPPTGPQSTINTNALLLFHHIMARDNVVSRDNVNNVVSGDTIVQKQLKEKYVNATWRNLHWLPHSVIVYEVRVREGWGMRWARDLGKGKGGGGGGGGGKDVVKGEKAGDEESGGEKLEDRPWMFRGFLEPPMENGHEVGWRHPVLE